MVNPRPLTPLQASSLWDVPPNKQAGDAPPKNDLNPVGSWHEVAGWEGDAEASKLQGILDDRLYPPTHNTHIRTRMHSLTRKHVLYGT